MLGEERARWYPANTGGWQLNHKRVREIARFVFGVQNPITVTRRRTAGKLWSGWHCWNGVTHRVHICVYPGTSVHDFLSTLAHELTHARQAEAAGSPFAWERERALAIRDAAGKAALSQAALAAVDGVRTELWYEQEADREAERLWTALLPAVRLAKRGTLKPQRKETT